MSLEPQQPTFHRGSFVDEIETARTDLARKLLVGSPATSPSDSETAPSLSPAASATSTTPESDAAISPISPPIDEEFVADSFAFAFDIDGVLVRGGRPIPEAVQAMKVLNGNNKYGVKIPYIFLTNGGGKSEAERCGDLSSQLDIEISPAQFICGHTPMSEMANKYNTVLVVGGEGEKCRTVAQGYGFKDVVTPGDIIKADAATTPFRKLTPEEHQNSKERDFSKVTIEAIFVFADSRDWAGDLQIILDLAMSKGGRIGTLSETFDEGPPIFFSHNDVVWSAAHDNVRLGMGALRGIVEYTFKEVTKGKTLETHAFGKPQIGTFEFATRLLKRWRMNQHRLNKAPETVYFVGDTPESDIRGTNQYNEKAENDWYSILVKTGVYQDGTEPAYKPRVTVNTVLDAVNHGIEREMERRKKNKTQKPRLSDMPKLSLEEAQDCAVFSPAEERPLELTA
ncbi:putative CDP-alcohol phosphatidyltransferase class-I family protein C22A12.08c [Daldinia childiae]|uniref:putative CDP-alcohol phosphatidyltransferase class-I family protein C22A12.08c n=1 Tax=Daldinia childiae TaxID=326645 RepID=UPI0014453DF6|nr:putative CDP-alcohol phosphatidyltransferase class-I family protein C22A12.08c [Daldinia childiae]KAF3063835.1 putative CDP-alcohol phosphatidyltransferase class-I family protein C22A12.08c [Daldinia childiae]